MKVLLTLTIVLAAPLASAQSKDSWFNPFPGAYALRDSGPVEQIPHSQFFEVAASKEQGAENELANGPARSLNQNEPAFYGSDAFKCNESTYPYLVRAIYENGGTGTFSVTTYGTALVISHASLGKASGMHRTALVVCLGSKTLPTAVYHSVGGAL